MTSLSPRAVACDDGVREAPAVRSECDNDSRSGKEPATEERADGEERIPPRPSPAEQRSGGNKRGPGGYGEAVSRISSGPLTRALILFAGRRRRGSLGEALCAGQDG